MKIILTRGGGAKDKTMVFGLLKTQGKIFFEISPDFTSDVLKKVIRGKVQVASVAGLMG